MNPRGGISSVNGLAALAAAIVCVLVLAAGMKVPAQPIRPGSRPLRVVASFYPLYDFAARIGGARAEVRALVPAGSEPHAYEPTPRDVAALAAADIFVYNGAGFERWQRRLARQLPARVVRVQATANVPLRRLVEERAGHGSHENGAGEPDPHVWLDPVLAQRQVDNVLAGFVRADRGGSAMYAASARRLRQDLSDLHRRFEARLGTCRQRHFITTHAAFGYLAARYRLTMIAVAGIAPEAEPSPRKLQELVREARSRGVGAVFSESAADPKVAEVLAREIGARTLTLSPLEYLTREQRRAGATYFTVMDENLRNLADGLGCR